MSTSASSSSRLVGRTSTSAAGACLLIVNLGALEAAAEVDVDRLPLGVGVERGVAGLAMPVSRFLPATEWQVRLGPRRARVDVNDAGLEVAHGPERGVRIAGEDRRREAVASL